MSEDKPVGVSVLGSGKTYDTVVRPGDTPREVLARVIEGDHENLYLRAGTGREFVSDTDLYEEVDEGEVLFGGTNMVVGTGDVQTRNRARMKQIAGSRPASAKATRVQRQRRMP